MVTSAPRGMSRWDADEGSAGVATVASGGSSLPNVRAGGSSATSDSTAVIGRRIVAALVDFALLGAIFWAVGIAGSTSSASRSSVDSGPVATIVYLLIGLAYFCAAEAATGQTVGKRLLGLRVTRADGSRAEIGRVVVRTLFRPIDAIGGYLVGLVSVLVTARRQRLGDLFADTVVVRTRR